MDKRNTSSIQDDTKVYNKFKIHNRVLTDPDLWGFQRIRAPAYKNFKHN